MLLQRLLCLVGLRIALQQITLEGEQRYTVEIHCLLVAAQDYTDHSHYCIDLQCPSRQQSPEIGSISSSAYISTRGKAQTTYQDVLPQIINRSIHHSQQANPV